ncbi:MAG: cyclic nucleotide-binding domain-containing protein [Geodermatophilaceae bacterium]|nr:cyclic nucleotide-binding domain-containing protein [Geodermatophilaceae bacterium]
MTTALNPAALRELFLFEKLTDEQLDWVAARGAVASFGAGTVVAQEGDPAVSLYVLLSGTLTLSRLVRGSNLEITRSDHKGAYAGATQFYIGDQVRQNYATTLVAVTDCTFLVLPAVEFAVIFREWYPMAVHLLQGMFLGMRNTNEVVGQRERLLALGQLSAGLMHELNNPAAAAARATAALDERLVGVRHALAMLAGEDLDRAALKRLTVLQEDFLSRGAPTPPLSAMASSDREDEVGQWLEEHGIDTAWEAAPVFVAGGVAVPELEDVAAAVDASFLPMALQWLAYTMETVALLSEITDAMSRISTLVGAARQYSQMDRAPHQIIDVHDGLVSTMVMLLSKLGPGIEVVKDFDRALPKVPAFAGELNQVWTNLIHNAIDAMAGEGVLTLRTRPDSAGVLVEICDTGPGVPEELRRQIFEPFFTTKGVGEGTGLGLDVSRRIVVDRHGGDLQVRSEPGDTCFQVRLPLEEPTPHD